MSAFPEPPAAAEMAGEGDGVLGLGLVDVLEVRHEAVAVPAREEDGDAGITDRLNHLICPGGWSIKMGLKLRPILC